MKPKVLVVDDHPMIIHAVEAMLHEISPTIEVVQARTLLQALASCRELEDIVLILLDLNLPDSSHVKGVTLLHKEASEIPIIVYTGQEHESVRRACLRAGATEFVMKSGNRDALSGVVENILARIIPRSDSTKDQFKVELSARQQDVLRLLISGAKSKEIGVALSISDATVKTHIKVIYSRTFCRNRVELFHWHAAQMKSSA